MGGSGFWNGRTFVWTLVFHYGETKCCFFLSFCRISHQATNKIASSDESPLNFCSMGIVYLGQMTNPNFCLRVQKTAQNTAISIFFLKVCFMGQTFCSPTCKCAVVQFFWPSFFLEGGWPWQKVVMRGKKNSGHKFTTQFGVKNNQYIYWQRSKER